MSHFLLSRPLVLAVVLMTTSVDETPSFKTTTKRDNDRIAVKIEKSRATFVVNSPFGISQATIEQTGAKWPEVVILHLHLKGLENFRLTNDKLKIEASVSSQTGKVRIWKDGQEDKPLDGKSPYWFDIRMVGNDGKPATKIPLVDGYFEMELPTTLFAGNPKSISVSWIDFYRN